MRYFVQLQHKCATCRRESVDIVSTSEAPGLMYSRHFRDPKAPVLSWCASSMSEFAR